MFCTNCGSALPDGARFCPECGQRADVGRDTTPHPSEPAMVPMAPYSNPSLLERKRVHFLPSFLGDYFWPVAFAWFVVEVGGVIADFADNDFFSTLFVLFDFACSLVFLFAIRDGLIRIKSNAARFSKTAIVFDVLAFCVFLPLSLLLLFVYGDGLDLEDVNAGTGIAIGLLFVLWILVAIPDVIVSIIFGGMLRRHHSGNVANLGVAWILSIIGQFVSLLLGVAGAEMVGSVIAFILWMPVVFTLRACLDRRRNCPLEVA